MTIKPFCISLATVTLVLGAWAAWGQSAKDWPQHDLTRPQPQIVTPGTFSSQDAPGQPPSDAVVLFDGTGLSAWKSAKCIRTGPKCRETSWISGWRWKS